MALELRQSLKLNQKLIMTPQLQQAIKFLQLTRLELCQTVNQELELNPLLEEIPVDEITEKPLEDEGNERPSDEKPLPEVTVKETISDDFDWESYISEYNTAWISTPRDNSDDRNTFENLATPKTSLYSHLVWQLQLSNLNEDQKETGRYVIGNIDADGYLNETIENIADYTHKTRDHVLAVLERIHEFDPVGVGALDAKECLLIQARFQGLDGSTVERILTDHMKELEKRKYREIARKLNVSLEEVLSSVSIISSLEPKPGRFYNDDETIYIIPDVYVYKVGEEFVIVLNEDGLPKLRISNFYKDTLSKKDDLNKDTREYIRDKLKSASWLIKSIHQRQKTIYKVSESIVKFQGDFFRFGPKQLKPMVLRDIAEDINMHESTVSRVMNNKYMHTPFGVFVLKYFLNSTVQSIDGMDEIGSLSVKEKIKDIVKNENKHKPFSDNDIVNILKKANINLARRTVAKYREALKILPSNRRKDTYS